VSYPTVTGDAVEGVPYREAQSCLGPAYALATYKFFLTGTATPANVYQDGALTTPFPITGFVTADSYGRFPPIYLDTSVIYRVQFYDTTNTLRWTVDPYTALLATVGTSSKSPYGVNIATTGEVTIPAPATGGTGVSLTLKAGTLGITPLRIAGTLPGNSALIVNNSATTGTQTATFASSTKPGTQASAPAGWLPITCDGVQYYTPIWHGNPFTPYAASPSALGEAIIANSVTFTGSGLTTVTGGTATPSNWYSPSSNNIGANYDIQITKTSGLSGVVFSIGGTQTNIGSGGLTITNNAAASVSGTYNLLLHNTSTVVASGTITLSGGGGVQQPTINGVSFWGLNGDGTATLGGVATTNWYTPTTPSVGAGYWIYITQTGGTPGFSFSPVNVWANIGTGTGGGIGVVGGAGSFTITGTYQIASDSGGAHVLSSGNITLSSVSPVQSANYSGSMPLVLSGNGAATVGGSAAGGWYSPNSTNAGSGYYINITRTSGTAGVNFSAAQGSWTNITNSGLTVGMSGYTGDVGTVTVGGTYQISSSNTGTPVLGSGTISLSAAAGTVIHVYTSAVTNATETIPTGTTNVYCEVFGGGGGGGGGNQHPNPVIVYTGGTGGCGGLAYSVYTSAALGGAGNTFKYTVPSGGAGGAGGATGSTGGAGSITAGSVTGFTTMTGNGGVGGTGASVVGNGPGGAGGTGVGGNNTNNPGPTGSTAGTSGKISGDGSPYGGGATGGSGSGVSGSTGKSGAAVFYYT
jgi:hypothetical protein